MSGVGIDVSCDPAANGWTCGVALSRAGVLRSTHRVSVAAETLARLDPDAPDPVRLVRASFAFLLEREPPESILGTFELPVIGTYFPEWEADVAGRIRPPQPGDDET